MSDHIPIQGPATIQLSKPRSSTTMIISHADAVTKVCVSCHRFCAGEACMAWRHQIREEASVQTLPGSTLKFQGPIVEVPTGLGYCAIAYPHGAPS